MSGQKLLLYDGVCGLCNSLVRFLIARDRQDRLRFASLQSPTGRAVVLRHGGNPDELNTVYLVSDYEKESESIQLRGKAIFGALQSLGGGWRLPALLRFLPAFLLNIGYGIVARLRYRIWGRLEECRVPSPEERGKFLDT